MQEAHYSSILASLQDLCGKLTLLTVFRDRIFCIVQHTRTYCSVLWLQPSLNLDFLAQDPLCRNQPNSEKCWGARVNLNLCDLNFYLS